MVCARELIEEGLSQHGLDERDYFLLVAVDQSDQVAGYICYGKTPLTQAGWDVYWIATDPLFERRGVATALMIDAERAMAARQGQIVRVETSAMASYQAAQRFYEKMGYRLAGAIPDFYKSGDDLLLYWKKIAPVL